MGCFGHSDFADLTNQARLRRANTPNSSPPAAGHCDLSRSHKPSPPAAGQYSKIKPACGGPHLTNLTKQALQTTFCLKTAIFETFQSISHEPGRVRWSHLVRLVWKDQVVILSSLSPVFIPYNSARNNPNSSANPQHLDLLPVLPGTLPLPPDPPPSPFFYTRLATDLEGSAVLGCWKCWECVGCQGSDFRRRKDADMDRIWWMMSQERGCVLGAYSELPYYYYYYY